MTTCWITVSCASFALITSALRGLQGAVPLILNVISVGSAKAPLAKTVALTIPSDGVATATVGNMATIAAKAKCRPLTAAVMFYGAERHRSTENL